MFVAVAILLIATGAYGQSKYLPIKLPAAIGSINEEFSGMATFNNRVYILPQYGAHKPTKTDGPFNIYSINTDSISRVITGTDTALTDYRTIKVLNLNKLPLAVKKDYEGFESIVIINKTVYLSMETRDSTTTKCYLIKGILNVAKGQLIIDPYHYVTLKKPLFIKNAGFESITYLPKQNKLLAMYEFNAQVGGGTGYLIDPAFRTPALPIKTPFLYFRITDIAAHPDGRIYGINYYWSGD